MTFAKGMAVRLNSGGPLMTVREVNGDTITCDWFDKEERLRNAEFFVDQLKEDSAGAKIGELLEFIKAERQKW